MMAHMIAMKWRLLALFGHAQWGCRCPLLSFNETWDSTDFTISPSKLELDAKAHTLA
jgi:hypothetical protein